MKPLAAPVDKALILKELSKDIFIKNTNNANNEIYAFTAQQCPHLMKELGRVRELTFRASGGGTGNETDIDSYDTSSTPYTQLIVWDPVEKEIIGGYRYVICSDALDSMGNYNLATRHLFYFSESFKNDYLPYTIELGRSFVQPKYQATKENRTGLYALDNLWDGLGALIIQNPEKKYFFGKITMYNHFNRDARNLLLYFMHKYFPDKEKLVVPIKQEFDFNSFKYLDEIFRNNNFQEDYKILLQQLKQLNENIPPLFNAYMKVSSTMCVFGTSANNTFGPVEETGIFITINDIIPSKKDRHL